MFAPFLVHAIAMLAINLVAIRIGLRWDEIAHERHPFAAILPVGAIVSVLGCWIWYHGLNALSARSWTLCSTKSWLFLYLVVPCALIPVFFAMPGAPPVSAGRMVTLLLFALAVNGISVAVLVPSRNIDSPQILRRWLRKRWAKRALVACGSLLIIVMLIAAIEGLCYARNASMPLGAKKTHSGEYLSRGVFSRWDDNLGTALVPSADVQSKLDINDRNVWDVRYTNDSYGRRRTAHPAPKSAKRYAVFFGCSFLFGEGSNDIETIPSQFSEAAPQYHSYNYGVPGYGTQQMLAKLDSNRIRSEIQEEQGVVIYQYLEDVHEPRVIGGMQITNAFAWNYPYYRLNEAGTPVRKGNFTTGRPVLTKSYWLLGKSQFIKMMGINFPRLRDDHYRLTAAIIRESKRRSDVQLSPDAFVVVLYPRPDAHRRILPYLEEWGIKHLDYSDLFNPNDEAMHHVGDGHPTPAANRIIASQLAIDLPRLLQQPPPHADANNE